MFDAHARSDTQGVARHADRAAYPPTPDRPSTGAWAPGDGPHVRRWRSRDRAIRSGGRLRGHALAPGRPVPRWPLVGGGGVRGDRRTFLLGGVGGGVWKATNAGLTWTPRFDEQPIASIGALAIAPSDANVIYAGTGEAALRSNITFGAGVYRSSDGGAHWAHLGLDDTRQIGKIVVDPRNPDVVLVAALGHAYGPNPERGVFRSSDGGKTWERVLYREAEKGASDVARDPAHPDPVSPALCQRLR